MFLFVCFLLFWSCFGIFFFFFSSRRRHTRFALVSWARHLDGDGPRQVAAFGARRAELPGRHRGAGAKGPQGDGGPLAIGADELVPHARRLARGARRAPRPTSGGPAARLCAEQGTQAAGGRPYSRRVARRPGPRVVPTRPRRHLHGDPRIGRAGCVAVSYTHLRAHETKANLV